MTKTSSRRLCHFIGLATTVYWTPIWRPDQKEPPMREAAALRGMQSFFQSTGCLSPITIERLPAPANDQAPSDEVLLQRARTAQPDTDRVVLEQNAACQCAYALAKRRQVCDQRREDAGPRHGRSLAGSPAPSRLIGLAYLLDGINQPRSSSLT